MHKMFDSILLKLQFFAEGASGEGGGDGGNASPASDSLEALGVPADKVAKYRAKKGVVQNTGNAAQTAAASDSSGNTAQPAEQDEDAAWEEAKKNPIINKKMQETVNARLKAFATKNGDAQAKLDKLAPVLEIVGRKAGVDVSDLSKLNFDEFAQKVSADPSYYEDLAAEMGTDIDTARQIDQREREASRKEKATQAQQNELRMRQHFDGLVQQAKDLNGQGYKINLQAELADPWFARVTAPGGGLTVKQAYDAKYHDQMVNAAKQQTAMAARTAVSNAVRSGRGMPTENGTVPRAASPTTTKPYSQMNPAERDAYYKQLTGHNRRR